MRVESLEAVSKRKELWTALLDAAILEKRPFEFWREPKVLQASGLKRATMRAMIADGFFPPPQKLSERSSAWPSILVEEWQRQRIVQGRQTRAGRANAPLTAAASP